MTVSSNVARSRNVTRPRINVLPIIVAIVVIALLIAGWIERDEERITPDVGLGYWLGIAGGAAMLLLLIYSLRKRSRGLRSIGSIALWFRLHMMLGIIGPVLVLFHANFKLGSLNSNVALFTMLIVASSGVVGRYLYGRIHLGLYGRQAQMKDMLDEAALLEKQLGAELPFADRIVGQLNAFSHQLEVNPPRGLFSSLVLGGRLAISTRVLRMRMVAQVRALIKQVAKSQKWSWRQRRQRFARIRTILHSYFRAVLKAAEFTFYERLFALWHLLHLPLFFLMLLAGFVHVWAVHHY